MVESHWTKLMQSQAKQKLITHVVQRWNVSDDKRIAPCGTSNTAKKNEKLFFKISVVSIERVVAAKTKSDSSYLHPISSKWQ